MATIPAILAHGFFLATLLLAISKFTLLEPRI